MDIFFGVFVVFWMLFVNSYLHKALKTQRKILEELREIKIRLR